MSWLNECTLTYGEFQQILMYLKFLKAITTIFQTEPIDDLIARLEMWLAKE